MDNTERSKIDELVKSFNQFKETQYEFNSHCTKELSDISRGLYGDMKNNQPGIIAQLTTYDQEIHEIRQRVKTIERGNYKTRVWLGVGSASLVGIIEAFKSLWK